ncbi:ABC transporter substrate-binding protein [Vogesella sp. LIG4]|uniref:ABC transporter substrate-binding protein n=1 Tax=Vogesella sp. LIG4 TaxID=1192162 RepID=UPI00081FEEA7|nr:ABC transporter substrate-binding protein [Vogesella sp. LIG4]SCK21755.1 putative spermidine/putrescine transport system substrate-binding protein [Vogesella sp. LIG4]
MTKFAPRLAVLSVAVAFAAPAMAKDITVISFGGANKDAQTAAYYQTFEKTSGNKVTAGDYNGEMAKVKAMVDAKKVTWDVVEVESPELLRGCEDGMFEKIDWKQVGNKADFVKPAVSECGVGIFVWSTALAYNADKLKSAPQNWADFWNVQKFPGKRGLRKGAKYTLEFALMADGVKPTDVYKVLATKAGVDRAFKKLDQLKPNIQWWEAGAQPPQFLASGDVVMSSAYNGRIDTAQKEGKNLKVVWTGSVYDVDSWAVPKGSPNAKEAMAFIKHASKPENQAIYSNKIAYGPTNLKAVQKVDPKSAANLPTWPANLKNAVALDVNFWVEHGEDLEQRFNAWAAR